MESRRIGGLTCGAAAVGFAELVQSLDRQELQTRRAELLFEQVWPHLTDPHTPSSSTVPPRGPRGVDAGRGLGSEQAQCQLSLFDDGGREDADDNPWIAGPSVILQCGAEKEEQISSAHVAKVLLTYFFESCILIASAGFQAVPVKLPTLPIQHLQGAFPPGDIFELVGECIRKFGDKIECLSPGFLGKELSLLCLLSHLGDLGGIPIPIVVFPDKVSDAGWFEHRQ